MLNMPMLVEVGVGMQLQHWYQELKVLADTNQGDATVIFFLAASMFVQAVWWHTSVTHTFYKSDSAQGL